MVRRENMKTTLSKTLGIFITLAAVGVYAAPPPGPVVPPPGGTLAPGPVGGEMSPGPVGGAITPGNVLSAPPISGPAPSGIPGGTLYVGTNGVAGNRAVIVPPGGTLNNGVVGGANPGVIVAGRSNGISGGTLSSNGVGGANSGVVVGGGAQTTGGTGGTLVPGTGTGGTMNSGSSTSSSGAVIVGGGQP